MEQNNHTYDCAIIGGGLAGLCLAIKLADAQIETILFEKNIYPFHKVCGEYISMESWNYLISLGLPLNELNLPIINQLGISATSGFMMNSPLHMGGFGISRYSLDNYLYQIAVKKGVRIIQNCKVQLVDEKSANETLINTSEGVFIAKIVCGSYGKYAPSFILNDSNYSNSKNTNKANFIGVKYHIKSTLQPNKIELHNFHNGYCGISKVDNDRYCLCYLTHSSNLQNNNNNIKQMEEKVLFQNPFLKKIFNESEFINQIPHVISNVSFKTKQTHVNNMLLLGDAAGSISPLCGNGMSMGIRASKILGDILISHFNNAVDKNEIIKNYHLAWNKAFSNRIQMGYYLQYLFGKNSTTNVALKVLDKFPALANKIISLTHGKPF
jgi:flavin-dependent dehydrogenase